MSEERNSPAARPGANDASRGAAFRPDFSPPKPPRHAEFQLEPLGPEHNERDYDAWSSSLEHILRTPGFDADRGWPYPMSLTDNLRDLVQHADEFARREAFAYSVLIGAEVVGCVYIYPGDDSGDADVSSWVRADHAHLDEPLYRLVSGWLRREWPFRDISYAPRTPESEYA